jgi:FlgD Ig-like domain
MGFSTSKVALIRLVVLSALVLGLGSSAAHSAVGVPFATADFDGTNGGQIYFTVYGPVQASAHDHVYMRVTVISGELELDGGDAGAIWWGPAAAVPAGTAPNFPTRCQNVSQACAFHVDWFDVADIPTTVNGVITSGVTGESAVPFVSPIGGTYHVVVSLSNGSLVIEHNQCHDSANAPIDIPASGDYLLGQYAGGEQAICVYAPDGVSATWTIQFVKDPALVSSLTLGNKLIRPQDLTPFSYVIDSPAYISCWITDDSGKIVRTLSANRLTVPGTARQTFNGLDDAGQPLPDGEYTLQARVIGDINSEDQSSFTVDGTGPSISVPTRSVSTARGGLTVHIADSRSAIAAATIVARGATSRYSSVGNGTITFNPSRDWIIGKGKNTILITATDAAGNTTQLRQSLSYLPHGGAISPATRGHVDKSWISVLAHGTASRTFPHGTKALYASFHFGRLPTRGGRLTTTWYEPDGSATPTVSKGRTTLVRAFVKSASALPMGRWRCVLRINGVEVSETSVRVG